MKRKESTRISNRTLVLRVCVCVSSARLMMSARWLNCQSLSPISNSLGMPIKCKQRQTRVKIKTTTAAAAADRHWCDHWSGRRSRRWQMKTAAACGCEFSPKKRNWPAAAAATTRAALERFKFQLQRERKREKKTLLLRVCLPRSGQAHIPKRRRSGHKPRRAKRRIKWN